MLRSNDPKILLQPPHFDPCSYPMYLLYVYIFMFAVNLFLSLYDVNESLFIRQETHEHIQSYFLCHLCSAYGSFRELLLLPLPLL
jgi:hypothetical protein